MSPRQSVDGDRLSTEISSYDGISDAGLAPSAIPRSLASNNVRNAHSPFFGSSSAAGERHAARVASASSNTSKVLSSLQLELSTTRSALEQTKSQLRISQRAVESLSRQADESREAKERLRVEAESNSGRLARRERQMEELLARAQTAEAELGRAQSAEKEAIKRAQSLEKGTADAQARSQKAESERRALADGIAAMRAGFQREVQDARAQLDQLAASFESILGQQARKHDELSKLLLERTNAEAEVRSALRARQTFYAKHLETVTSLQDDIGRSLAATEDSRSRADEVVGDLKRLRRMIRDG